MRSLFIFFNSPFEVVVAFIRDFNRLDACTLKKFTEKRKHSLRFPDDLHKPGKVYSGYVPMIPIFCVYLQGI
jgi:hypothetical protein